MYSIRTHVSSVSVMTGKHLNGFAGSDLRSSKTLNIFSRMLIPFLLLQIIARCSWYVDVGMALMRGQSIPARAHKTILGKVEIVDIDTLEMNPQEVEEHSDDKLTPAVLRVVNVAIGKNQNVVLLSRMNRLPWQINYEDDGKSPAQNQLERFLELLSSYLPEDQAKKVEVFTAHRSKGLEKNVVIGLDAVPQCYPLIHPDYDLYSHMVGNTIERVTAEERRVFYVALTRYEDRSVYLDRDS